MTPEGYMTVYELGSYLTALTGSGKSDYVVRIQMGDDSIGFHEHDIKIDDKRTAVFL